jgi:hypothetical protein
MLGLELRWPLVTESTWGHCHRSVRVSRVWDAPMLAADADRVPYQGGGRCSGRGSPEHPASEDQQLWRGQAIRGLGSGDRPR